MSDSAKTGVGREALFFFAVACAWSWLFWSPVLLSTHGLIHGMPAYNAQWFYAIVFGNATTVTDWLTMFGAWGPFVGAIVTGHRFRGREALRIMWSRVLPPRVSPIWYVVALLIPVLYNLGALGIDAFFGDADSERVLVQQFDLSVPAYLYSIATMTVLFICEELGWRGYMQPALQSRYSALKATVWVGIAWAYWHIPFYLNLFYLSTESWTQAVLTTALSPLLAIPVAILMTWVFNSTGGAVFLCMLIHGANNSSVRFWSQYGDTSSSTLVAWLMAAVVIIVFGARNLSRKGKCVL